MEYYAAERKKELLPFATAWMGVERFSGTTIKDTWTKPRGRMEAREGDGFS